MVYAIWCWSHRTTSMFNFLNEHFDDSVIGLDNEMQAQRNMDSSAYLSDLKLCDSFLSEYLKDQVYRHNPQTINELVVMNLCC